MKYSVNLPIEHFDGTTEFMSQTAIVELAQAAEAAGFDALAVTDHPVPTGRWLDHGGHHAQDPFVMLAMAAAVTRTIKLQTGLLVLPYRNPFIVARSTSSLDAFSNGRFILGTGAGYMKGEYFALGADFEKRNEIMDEYLRALKAAWTQDEFTFEGTGYSARQHRILPRPLQQPHPPVWIGGNSKRAIRRAVDLGDGWMPFETTDQMAKTTRTRELQGADDLAEGIAYLKQYAKETGRTAPVEIALGLWTVPDHFDRFAELIAGYEKVGANWIVLNLPGKTRKEWIANAARFGERFVEKR
jgi:probable F420-dependent oxidoreductase